MFSHKNIIRAHHVQSAIPGRRMRVHREVQRRARKRSQVLPAFAPVLGLDRDVGSGLLASGVKSLGILRVHGKRGNNSMRTRGHQGDLCVVRSLLHRGHARGVGIDQAPALAAIGAPPQADAGGIEYIPILGIEYKQAHLPLQIEHAP